MTKTKEKTANSTKKEIIDIGSSHSDEEIVALEEKGYRLRFSEKNFRELDEATIEALSRENARDYFVTKGAFMALKRNETRKELGFDGLQVIDDPLRGKPRKKMEMRNVPKGWHGVWKRPDEVAESKALGFKLVPETVETPNATATSTSRVIAAKDGKDDLVAMMIPERLHLQHLHANAVQSRRNAGATMKEINRVVAGANKDLERVADVTDIVETTNEEVVSIRDDIRARR